jgi:hypothetical protein
MNLSSTSFDVDVGPQPEGSTPVQVTLLNGKNDSANFSFVENQPLITSIDPTFGPADATTLVTITGSGFLPGLLVSFGSENPVPASLTPTSFDVSVGPQSPGSGVSVVASYPSGKQDSTSFEFVDTSNVKTVFVTSSSTTGNIGGIAGGDALCNSLASAASLAGTYKAWLGDSTTDPASSFTMGNPYQLADGTLIAVSFADLTDGSLDAPISVDETGAPASSPTVAWTGVNSDGTFAGAGLACSDWTAAGNGLVGDRFSTTSTWTKHTVLNCSLELAIYCFEQ